MMQFFFFASSEYDFSLLSSLLHDKFCNAEVIGTTTSGEISNSGFTKNSIVLTALSCSRTRFSGIALDGVDKFPIVHKQELEDAARKIGIKCADPMSHKDAFAITFVNASLQCRRSTSFVFLFGNQKRQFYDCRRFCRR